MHSAPRTPSPNPNVFAPDVESRKTLAFSSFACIHFPKSKTQVLLFSQLVNVSKDKVVSQSFQQYHRAVANENFRSTSNVGGKILGRPDIGAPLQFILLLFVFLGAGDGKHGLSHVL